MEKKFGVFHTVAELNRAAAAQKAEGDLEALIALALENGLDREDAEDYMDGCGCEDETGAEVLCTPFMAAVGKLNREAEELGLKSQLADWKDYIIQLLTECGDECLAEAIFSPEKQLLDIMAAGLKKASQNRIQVDSKIRKAAGLPDRVTYIGMCGRDELREIVIDYYLGGRE